MSATADRPAAFEARLRHLPQVIASAALAVATVLVLSVDPQHSHWEWVIWPRYLQASALVLVAATLSLTAVPRGSRFERVFAGVLLALGILRALSLLNYRLPAILWPNTLLVAVLCLSGTVLFARSFRKAEGGPTS